MDVKIKIFGFYIFIIIALASIGNYNYSGGNEKGALLGIIISIILWDQYGRDMVAKDKSY
jgi:hypothetical protein